MQDGSKITDPHKPSTINIIDVNYDFLDDKFANSKNQN